MNDVLDLTCDLIARASVTPEDAGCQALLAGRLTAAGFACEHLRLGEVDNLWATHGSGAPVLVLLGHTDVVPPGPREAWTSDPFDPQIRDGVLYGRGAADMKGSVAAFVVAAEQFVAAHPAHAGTLAVLLTSDEEGDAIDGVRRVANLFRERGQAIDWCITGEPSSTERLGDLLRVGRRGSLSGTLAVKGCRGMWRTRTRRATRSIWQRPRWPNWSRGNGTMASKASRRPVCKSPISMPALAPIT